MNDNIELENRSAIDNIFAREEVVMVNGHKLVLKLPSEEKIKQVRALSSRIAVLNDQDGVTEELLEIANDLSILTISSCLNIDGATALRLLVSAGGEMSELSRKARSLLGLVTDEVGDDGLKVDPL